MSRENETIRRIVSRIPHGRVATYGQIARLAGIPRQARRVGYALRTLPEGTAIPWQRVVNASGEISKRGDPATESLQAQLLRLEGIVFRRGKISLDQYQWRPKI